MLFNRVLLSLPTLVLLQHPHFAMQKRSEHFNVGDMVIEDKLNVESNRSLLLLEGLERFFPYPGEIK
jgi:hypothetical protein